MQTWVVSLNFTYSDLGIIGCGNPPWISRSLETYFQALPLPQNSIADSDLTQGILHRFWQTDAYKKQPLNSSEAEGSFVEDEAKAHPSGVKKTMKPAVNILVSRLINPYRPALRNSDRFPQTSSGYYDFLRTTFTTSAQ